MTTFVLTTPGRNAACNGFVDGLNGGALIVKDATVTLATFTLGTPAFGNAATGTASLTAAITGVTPAAAGTPDSFVINNSTAAQWASGDAGTTGVTLTTSATLATTDTVDLTAFTVTVPAS